MESTDAFAQDTTNDPFAADDFGDWTSDASSELPVVDKEGNPAPPNGQATAAMDPALPDAQVVVHPTDGPPRIVPGTVEQTAAEPPAEAQPAPAPQVGPTPEAKAAMDAIRPNHQPADGASAETQDAPAATPAPQPPQAAPAPVEVAKEAVQPAQDAPGAPEPVPAAEKVATALAPDEVPQETAQEAEATPEDDEPEAEMPEEPKDAKTGRVTHRRYCILRADGPDKFAKLSWYEDKERNLVQKGTPGARKQSVRLARTTEEALRFGFAVLGGPQDGATLVAVAALYFQPRKVAPAPVQPTRQRLKIS